MSLQAARARNQYPLVEKLRIADIALSKGWIRHTARTEGVSPRNVRRWVDQRDKIEKKVQELKKRSQVYKYRLSGSGGIPTFGREVDFALLSYHRSRREANKVVNVRLLLKKWRELQPGVSQGLTPKACSMRMYRFMHRHGLSIRRRTHKAQENRADQNVIDDFVAYIKWKKLVMGITNDDAVANFDETNVYFAPTFDTTIEERGSRTVSIQSAKSSNRCTAMLGCTMGGTMLTPFVIWQGENTPGGKIRAECEMPSQHGYAPGLVYTVQSKAWMNEVAMKYWVEWVWKPYAASVEGPTILILDEATSHLTRAVKHSIAECGTELEIIPGGYTSKLQVLDVGLNKPFKGYVRECVEDFVDDAPAGAKPKRQDVSHWIKNAWERLSPEMAINTWKRIGYKDDDDEEENDENQNGNVNDSTSNESSLPIDSSDDDNSSFCFHDPLAENPGETQYSTNDEDYNSDDSFEY